MLSTTDTTVLGLLTATLRGDPLALAALTDLLRENGFGEEAEAFTARMAVLERLAAAMEGDAAASRSLSDLMKEHGCAVAAEALAERMRDDHKTFTLRDTEDDAQPDRTVEAEIASDGSLAIRPEGHGETPVYVEFQHGRPVLVLFQDEHGDPEHFRLYKHDDGPDDEDDDEPGDG